MAWYHAMARTYWKIRKPLTLGVRVIVTNEERGVLLIRHTYTHGWYLPGGGVERRESFEGAARRELWEECGIQAPLLKLCHLFYSEREGKRDHIALFHLDTGVFPELNKDDKEVADLRFFAWDQLPEELSPATRRRLEQFRNQSFPSDRW